MEEAGELVLAAVEEAAGAEAAVPGARQVAVLCEAAGRAQQQDCGHAQQGQRNTRGGHGESVVRPGLLDRALSAPGIYPPPPSPFPPHTASVAGSTPLLSLLFHAFISISISFCSICKLMLIINYVLIIKFSKRNNEIIT